jgi:serine protease AprX
MENKLFKTLIIVLVSLPILSEAQTKTKYWVRFTDKNGSSYSVSNPSAFLSVRAIARRTKQNISIVENDLPVNSGYINSVLATGAVTLLNRSKWFNAISIYTTDQAALNAIKALPFVVQVDSVARKNPVKRNTFEELSDKGSSQRNAGTQAYDYGMALNQVQMIGADCMHSKGFDGQGMVIAILDAGFNNADIVSAFDSVRTNNQILGTWDFVSGNSNVYDDDQHGEAVFSCIAANLPGQMIGTAPKASFWLLRTEDAPTENIIEEHNWVSGAEFADSVGADVINSSLGYTEFDDPSEDHTYFDMNGNTAIATIAADIAASKGILVVNSAGNSGGDAWYYIGAPADGDSVLAVGAVDWNGNYAAFSSHGPSSDGDVKPNVSAQGSGTIVYYSGGYIGTGNGTSFSSPLMAGAAACLWQAHPTATNMQIFDAIQQSGSQFSTPDSELGYGIPDMCLADDILNGLTGLFPNPTFGSFQYNYFSKNGETLVIELLDIRGRLISSGQKSVAPNSTTRFFDNSFEYLAKGLYLLKVQTQEGLMVTKFCKL